MATGHRSVCGNPSNAAVVRVTRQLRVCGTTQSTSTHQCLLRLSGRCSNKMLVKNVPRNPHQQLLILKTATFSWEALSNPLKKLKCMLYIFSPVILEWRIFVELMILYICTCNHHAHIHYFNIKVLKATDFLKVFFRPHPHPKGELGNVVYLAVPQY